jgi:hypothetical protein
MKKEQEQPPDSTRLGLGGAEPFDALFGHARRDALTPLETERLWQSVISAGAAAPGNGGPGVVGGSLPGWASGAALKASSALLLAGGLVAVVLALRAPGPRQPIASLGGAVPPATAIEAPRGEMGPPVVSWDELPRARGVASQAEARPSAAPAPRARGGVSSPEPAAAADPEGALSAAPEPAPAEVVAAPPSPSEGALLLRARQQLTSNPSSALELTDEAGRRFPDGALAPEREVLAIEALARLGRLASARTRFAVFRSRYPQSPHLARLEVLLGQ